MDKLVRRVGWNSFLGDRELGNCLCTTVAARVGSRSVAVDMAESEIPKVTAEIDDFIRVNVLVSAACPGQVVVTL